MNDSSQVTIHSWLQLAQKELRKAQIDSYSLDALLLIESITGFGRAHILAHPEKPLNQHEVQKLHRLLARRVKREPIAYILNECEFYGHKFVVNNHVLIPRPESEAFIELIKTLPIKMSVVDVGCGSGAIGISIKLTRPDTNVILSDISSHALQVARKNAKRLGADVVTKKMDLLSKISTATDVVVANLPYVSPAMKLEKDLSYEPKIALFSDRNGMAHYQRLWLQITTLQPQFVLTESLAHQHAAMHELAKSARYTIQSSQGLVQLFIRN
jgi:release factor glutamine methyltransferase